MILHGRIEGGKIVLSEDVTLPEGGTVEVYVKKPRHDGPRHMNPALEKYIGIADDLPPDASQSIDRVLYGLPEE